MILICVLLTCIGTHIRGLGLLFWGFCWGAALCRLTSVRCRSVLWPSVAAIVLLCRIGEAANPGPKPHSSFALGAFNPSGLPGKAPYLVSHLAHGDVWAVSETHLSEHAMHQFRASMQFARGPYRYMIGGHPVPAQNDRTYHASWRGVATISKHPTRAVPTHLPADVFGSSRAVPGAHHYDAHPGHLGHGWCGVR